MNPHFAGVHCRGKVIINDKKFYKDTTKETETKTWSYQVQNKLGETMENYLFAREQPFSEKTVFQIGLELLESFKMIHEAGYIFNDLKLDNVLIGDDQSLPQAQSSLFKIRLIDFGLAKKYTKKDGTHVPQKKNSVFEGNLIYSSVNSMNLQTTSRRDDLISLCYFLIYILDGDLPFLAEY